MPTAIRATVLILALGFSPAFGFAQDEFDQEFADEFEAEFGSDAQESGGSRAAEPRAPSQEPEAAGDTEMYEFDEVSGELSAQPAGPSETSQASESPEAPPSETLAKARMEPRFRLHNTLTGPVGGVRIVDARSAPAKTFRVQLATEFFFASDFLVANDDNDFVGGTLSLNYTVLDFLEVFGAISAFANANDRQDPPLIQTLGDLHVGVKGFVDVLPWLSVGGDLTLAFLNKTGDVGVVLDGTSAGIRGNATADLRYIPARVPLLLRFNAQYWFDNSANLVEDVEDARFRALPDPSARADETRHLLSPVERFALGINRTDFFNLGLGFEAPLVAAKDLHVSPLLEWRWGIPINRQGYDCPFDPSATDEVDGCLDREGLSSFPQSLTLGVRVLPPVRGLSALAAVDVGLTGTGLGDGVRELAANRPYNVMLAVGYAYDPVRPPVEQAVEAAPAPETPSAPAGWRIAGTVVDEETSVPVQGAVVEFVDLDLTPLYTTEGGRFVSYVLDSDRATLRIKHPGYEDAVCTVDDDAPRTSEESEREEASDALVREVRRVSKTCELKALPKLGAVEGRLTDEGGSPVAATITLQGPAQKTVEAGADGAFSAAELPPGDYKMRIESDSHFLQVLQFAVEPRETQRLDVQMTSLPKRPLVQVRDRELQLRRQINFATNSDEILPTSYPLLMEVADALLRNLDIQLVEIQGHTDNRGPRQLNMDLSQRRAQAVHQWLTEHGVDPHRMEARGYGDTRPIVPNITSANRARNRRVQFVIKTRASAPSQ